MQARCGGAFVLIIFLLLSCQSEWKTEKEEANYWNTTVVDTAYKVLYQDHHPKRALQLFDSLLQNTQRTSPYVEASRFGLIANYQWFLTRDNEATSRYVDSALAVYKTPDLQKRYARSYVGLLIFGGEIAFRLANYSKSNEYFFFAKQVADQYLDPCDRSGFTYNVAMVSYRQQNYPQSAAYFREAFASQATCPIQTTAIVLQQQEILSNIGLCLVRLKQYDSALVYFNRSIEMAEQYKDSLGPITVDKIRGVISGNIAKIFVARGDFKKAEPLFQKSIALNSRPGYEIHDALLAQVQLAGVYQSQQQFVEMFVTLQAVRKGLDSLPNAEGEVAWRQLMAGYYKATNEPLKELHYFKQYIAMRDSMTSNQKQLLQADISRQLKDKEQSLHIAVLTKNNQLNQIYLWVFISLSVMAVVIVVLIYQNYKRSKQSVAALTQLNSEVNRQKAALEVANQEKDRILQVVAHDLRNPIGITVYLSDLTLMEEMDEKGKAYLQTIKTAAQQALHLTNELLGIKGGEETFVRKETIDLISLTKETVQLLQYKAAEKGQQVVIEVGEKSLIVNGSSERLNRMVSNLLVNAIKFSPLQGCITVRLEKEKNKAVLSIADNGIGIAAGEEELIFERFTKARRRGTSGEKSFGLGLSICRDIVKEHQGSIDLYSEEGTGTSFFVRLPLANDV